MSFLNLFLNIEPTLIDAYSFQVKAYESEGDFIHGDYIILNKVFIPSEKIEYHFHNIFLIVYEQTKENYIQYLNDSNTPIGLLGSTHSIERNTNKEISFEEYGGDKIYNLKQIKLKSEYVDKLKKYYNIDKQRKILFNEIKNM